MSATQSHARGPMRSRPLAALQRALPSLHPSREGGSGAAGLRVVPPVRRTASRGMFAVVVCGVLLAGLVSLLGINTLLAQGSFTEHDLQAEVAALRDREAALQEEVAQLASPNRLAEKARSLGMVPAAAPAFIKLSDGTVIGSPEAAEAPPAPVKPAPAPVVPDPAAAAPADPNAVPPPADPATTAPTTPPTDATTPAQ